jgi:hypothetical protein
MRSLSFKTKRSPAKSPRGGVSAPCSPDTSPRSNTSRASSPRLTTIRTVDDAPLAGAPAGAFRQPRWEASSTVFDPLEARARAQRAHLGGGLPPELLGSAVGGPAAGPSHDDGAGGTSANVAGGMAEGAGASDDGAVSFEAAYEGAADMAAVALMQRATARGEKFSVHIGRPDFVAALTLMASHLALSASLDAAQIEQLFEAVAAGSETVQFEDFIEAPSTRYYLMQLADAAPGPRPREKEPHLEA